MPAKHPKRPRDLSQWAKHMVDLATQGNFKVVMSSKPNPSGEHQNPPPRRYWQARVRPHWLEFVLGVGLLIVGAAQVLIYLRQASIMQMQANIMQQQTVISEAEHRPWISASGVALVGDMTHGDAGLSMIVQFTMKNTGHSPAHRAFPAFIPTFPPWGEPTRQEACKMADNKLLGIAIFPGDSSIIQDIEGTIPESQFVALKEGKIPGAVALCVGIRYGAISSGMTLSVQAARSIG